MAAKWTGLNGVLRNISALEAEGVNVAEREVLRSAETVRRNTVFDIQRQNAPGRSGTKPAVDGLVSQTVSAPSASGGGSLPASRKKNKKHVPSAPGNPPNTDTGRLAGSYISTLERVGTRIVAWIGTNVRYGKWLEDGTSRMKPRPHLRPRYYEELPNLPARLKTALSAAAKKHSGSRR